MARIPILKKDGTPTQYFWSDKDSSEPTRRRIYKQTTDGVKRMKDLRFNSVTNRILRRA